MSEAKLKAAYAEFAASAKGKITNIGDVKATAPTSTKIVDVRDLYQIGKTYTGTPESKESLAGITALYGQPTPGVPSEATITQVKAEPKGYTVKYVTPAPSLTLSEVWMGKMTPQQFGEYLLSSLVFRNLWDVNYQKQLAKIPKLTPEERYVASAERSNQLALAVSVAMVGWTAFDIARGIYTVWKGRSTLKEPLVMSSASEEKLAEQFQVTQVTGPKGARLFETSSIEPTENFVTDTFNIAPTRGTWRYSRLDKLIKETKASTTLYDLMQVTNVLTEPFTVFSDVPMAAYVPRMISETAFTGMALGQLTRQPSRTISRTASFEKPATLNRILQSSGLNLGQVARFDQIQQVGVKQMQALESAQLQRQIQKQQSQQIFKFDFEFPSFKQRRSGRKRKGKWMKKTQPIAEAEQAKRLLKRFGI
jgi:hypothetical protein